MNGQATVLSIPIDRSTFHFANDTKLCPFALIPTLNAAVRCQGPVYNAWQ